MIVNNTERDTTYNDTGDPLRTPKLTWLRRYIHQQQPTKTTCGPTTVAILTSKPVREIMMHVRSVRIPRRQGRRDYRLNLMEMSRLLARYGVALEGRRWAGWPGKDQTAVIRLAYRGGRHGWHWMLWDRGVVYDPLDLEPEYLPTHRWEETRISHYMVKS